jgi:hypothetical protein
MPLVSFTTLQYTVYQELEKLVKLSLSFLFGKDKVKIKKLQAPAVKINK